MPKTATATPKTTPAAPTTTPTTTAAPQEQHPAYPMHYDVRIYPVRNGGTLRANVSVNINDAFAISKVRVVEGSKGLFVSMPQYKGQNGEWKDICFPRTTEAHKQFSDAVLDAYQQKLEQMQTAAELQEQESPSPEQGPAMSM